jgi:cell division protein FtsQ
MYVNTDSEIELIPRVGDHTILIGNTNNLEEKMQNLFVFYTQAMKKAGWNEYEMINLKYRGQVVCSKKNSPN